MNAEMQVIKKNTDFKAVYQHGRSYANRYVVLYILPRERQPLRVGFSVSKRVGCAVVRNKVKRLFREFFRLHWQQFGNNRDVVIIARNPVKGLTYWQISDALTQLCHRASLWKKPGGNPT